MAESTLGEYLPVLILLALAFIVIFVTLSLTKLVAPRRNVPGRYSTYESGEVPVGNARGPIDVQYYLYVISFLILDVEVLFLVPWALNFRTLPPFAMGAMALFVGLIIVGWAYEWKKGALEWQS